ncbi:MAG: hybrid sensor histidine kinase/response regulator, partial [Flavobacteriaceae bacterium]|nr:hybrid sensor histidine kinase/response regulator [Flavobacteriaceae bacterium]
ILETIKDLLDPQAYELKTARGVDDALAILNGWYPDIIVSDIMMPKTDGYQFLNKLRSEKALSDIPFIFLTAKSSTEDFRKSMLKGADDFISKPFKVNELKEAINVRIQRVKKLKKESALDLISSNFDKHFSHEVKTPLYGILGSIDLLTKYEESLSKKDLSEIYPALKSSAERLNKTFQNILLLQKNLKTEKSKKKNFKTKIHTVVNDVVSSICDLNTIDFSRFDLQIIEHEINIDVDTISYIIFEIITNAIKFSPQDSPIVITSQVDDKFYNLIIKDFGIGFSKKQIDSIGPFKQYNRISLEQQGMGLGLYLSKSLLEKEFGELQIKSKKGSYTQVHLKILL